MARLAADIHSHLSKTCSIHRVILIFSKSSWSSYTDCNLYLHAG